MEKKRKSGTAYLMQLAGKYKLHLFVSALFGIASALCSFVPYVMVYRSILVLLDGEGNALRYGLIAAAAIAGKFLCSIVSGTFSHIGAFNTLYNVRTQISRHIAKVNLGFFTDHASGEIKKVIIEDVERIERFLAHQIPDVTSAICAPVIVFIYLLTIIQVTTTRLSQLVASSTARWFRLTILTNNAMAATVTATMVLIPTSCP